MTFQPRKLWHHKKYNYSRVINFDRIFRSFSLDRVTETAGKAGEGANVYNLAGKAGK